MNTLTLSLADARTAASNASAEPVTGQPITEADTLDGDTFTAWINKTLPTVLCVSHDGGSDQYEATYFA